jgi:Uma2 family endonuclease
MEALRAIERTESDFIELKKTWRKPVLPFKLEDRLGMAPEVRVKASFAQFIELSIEAEYKVEYMDGYVISIFDYDKKTDTMSTASLTHENLVANLILELGIAFYDYSSVRILGSNMPTFIAEGEGTCNPDVSLVKQDPIIKKYKANKKIQHCLLNPSIVVEVLSQGTKQYDLAEKLGKYQKIESLEQIVYIEQYWTEITTYIRVSDNRWLQIKLEKADEVLPIGNLEIPLSKIYRKINFDRP